MKINGKTLSSRGKEIVYIDGERYRKNVYQMPDKWVFYVTHYGEKIEVYHKTDYFSNRKGRYT